MRIFFILSLISSQPRVWWIFLFWDVSFYFLGFASFLLKYKKFFKEKYKIYLSLGLGSFIFQNIKKCFLGGKYKKFFQSGFVSFLELGLKCGTGSPGVYYQNNLPNFYSTANVYVTVQIILWNGKVSFFSKKGNDGANIKLSQKVEFIQSKYE